MIIEQHYDEEVLAAFLDEPVDSMARDKHLASCPMCRKTLGSLRATTELLGESSVWDSRPLSSAPQPGTLAFLRGVAKTMKDEDSTAVLWIKQLLAGSRETWAAKLVEHAEWRTGGMVRQLIKASDQAINTVPAEALALSTMAVEIAEGLDASTQTRHLQGMAYYQHGYALWYRGSVPEALAVFESARERLESSPGSELDHARVDIMRALVFQLLERRDEALAMSDRAAAVFSRYQDVDRFAAARSVTAATLQSAQRLREALAVNADIVQTNGISDRWRFSAIHNMALCYSDLGELGRAAESLAVAITGYERIGMMTFRSRSRWALADVFARQGRHSDALPLYTQLRQEFQELEMANEVALLSLDESESLIALSRHDEVGAVCKAALDYFATAGLAHTEPALRGLAYLQEAVAAGRLTPGAIRGVRAFLLAPSERPEPLFLEPPQ